MTTRNIRAAMAGARARSAGKTRRMTHMRTTMKKLLRFALPALALTALAPAALSAAIPAPDGLVFWWPGDGTANDFVVGNDGTFAGSYADGKVALGFALNGSNSIPTNQLGPTGANARTVDAWIRVTGTGGGERSQAILDYGDPRITGGEFFFSVEGERNKLGLRTQNARKIVDAPALADGNFHHVAVVMPQGAKVADVLFYVDGQPATNVVTSTTADNGTVNATIAIATAGGAGAKPIRLGAFVNAPNLFTFTGVIDEVQVFGRALDPGEIAALYNAGSAGKCKPRDAVLQALAAMLNAMGATSIPQQLQNAMDAQNLNALNGALNGFKGWLNGSSSGTAALDQNERSVLANYTNYIQAMLAEPACQ